jgi:hypothetical protein
MMMLFRRSRFRVRSSVDIEMAGGLAADTSARRWRRRYETIPDLNMS